MSDAARPFMDQQATFPASWDQLYAMLDAFAAEQTARAEVAEALVNYLRPRYRDLMGHHRYICSCDKASDEAMSAVDTDSLGQRLAEECRALTALYDHVKTHHGHFPCHEPLIAAVERARQP